MQLKFNAIMSSAQPQNQEKVLHLLQKGQQDLVAIQINKDRERRVRRRVESVWGNRKKEENKIY